MMSDKLERGYGPKEEVQVTREDFELACIREFSHSGQHLGIGVSRGERRERIRAAILGESKAHRRWHGSSYTYAEIYAQAYQQTLAKGDSPEKSTLGAWRAGMDEDLADDDAVDV